MINFHSRRYVSLSLFEESSKDTMLESAPVKRGRGRPPKLKAIANEISDKNENTNESFMPSTFPSETELNPLKEMENIVALSPAEDSLEEVASTEEVNSENGWETEQNNSFDLEDDSQIFEENYDESFGDEEAPEVRDFSQNSVNVSFSWSLMNQLRQMSKMEGISVEDLLVELVAEGVTKRVFEDQSRPTPSHLMTRTGYVHSDGTQTSPQPHLSHHMMNNSRQQQNNVQNRNRFGFQQRNQQHTSQNMNNRNNVNRNYQQNNSRQQNLGQNGFRNQYQNNNSQQQRFNNTRSNNYQNTQRFYDEQSTNTNNNQYNRQQRDNNKR
ncbi:hypothetical protein ACWNT8_03790 [Pigmentibacter ruber]|uniref:hypothetical protein n=1 Tax=Pigmentibacter ruber TaxID=2683196 RepID=UPI00131BEAF2|nr:hypothetical protein [Pigmentibacter ruber]BFD30543.1 hypothetical protein GTC16762_01610 [Pigmentibacter ruber]